MRIKECLVYFHYVDFEGKTEAGDAAEELDGGIRLEIDWRIIIIIILLLLFDILFYTFWIIK